MKVLKINLISGEEEIILLPAEEIAAIAIAEQQRLASITYEDKRRAEYPSFADQLDLLYHKGYEGWKAVITAIKEKYPKE